MKVELAHIAADTAAQPRTTIKAEKVAEYVEDMQRGDRFPAMVVFKEAEKFWLADGFHRYYAAKTAGLETFNCDVRPGSLRDAILFSCGANASHGLRRTNDDKRRAVVKLLDDAEWASWSDSEIARHCAVDAGTVAKYRKEMAAHTSEIGSMERTFTHPKTGEPAVMNVASIGRGTAAAEDDARKPARIAEALKQIKRSIDAMPDPESAARDFPPDQWYFYPLSDIEEMASWLNAFAAEWRQRAQRRAS